MIRASFFGLAVVLTTSVAMAANIIVTTTQDIVDPDDGLLSLRDAVLTANTTQGTDKILLPAGRSYRTEVWKRNHEIYQ